MECPAGHKSNEKCVNPLCMAEPPVAHEETKPGKYMTQLNRRMMLILDSTQTTHDKDDLKEERLNCS